MLPRVHRLTEAASFSTAVRSGRRSGSRTLVVHLAPAASTGDSGREPARAGLVVSRSVGNAVVRNRVKRRLRHLLREHLPSLPGGSLLVVRALPAAGLAGSAELDRDLGRCLSRCLDQASR